MKLQRLSILPGILLLGLIAAGCSSSSTDTAATAEDVPVTAGTDEVPGENIESFENQVASIEEQPKDNIDQFEAAALEEPAASPTPEALPATEPPPPATLAAPSMGEHRMQSGETLMMVAFETYGDVSMWRKIYDLNRDVIADPNNVPVGTTLKIETPSGGPVVIERNGERYRIEKGDTLGTISKEVYGTPSKWRKLYDNNRQLIKNPNLIYAGFYLHYTFTDSDREEKANYIASGGDSFDRVPSTEKRKQKEEAPAVPPAPSADDMGGLPQLNSL